MLLRRPPKGDRPADFVFFHGFRSPPLSPRRFFFKRTVEYGSMGVMISFRISVLPTYIG